MRQQSSFIGFDFENDWDIYSGINDGYPYLRLPRWSTPHPTERLSSWAMTDVSRAVLLNLVPENLQFEFAQTMTRAEFCALAVALYEKATGKEITERIEFDDTIDANVEMMAAIGVVFGTSPGTFTPNAQLTREQAATMLMRLADAIGRQLPQAAIIFADRDSISEWALEAVGQVQAAGIMNGVSIYEFLPKGLYTREQSIVTMLRMYEAMK